MQNTHWHIIRCTSGQEGRAERYLERMGYPHGWHPTEKVRLSEAVYQRLLSAAKKLPSFAQSRKPERYKFKTIVTGYVFLPADEVEIHKINGHHPNVWMEVLCVRDAPYRLTNEQMAQMKEVPARVQELVEEAERKAREAWEARRPVVGKKALVTSGMFGGKEGVVSRCDGGAVEVDLGGLLGRVSFPEQIVEKV